MNAGICQRGPVFSSIGRAKRKEQGIFVWLSVVSPAAAERSIFPGRKKVPAEEPPAVHSKLPALN